MDKSNSKAINLIGQKFGKLTVISRAENSKFGQAKWNCICECGSLTQSLGFNLRKMRSLSCGCQRLLNSQKSKKENQKKIIGKRYYMMEVVGIDDKKKSTVICKCDCGIIKSISISDFKKGSNKSCGCSSKKFISESLKKSDEHHKVKRHERYLKRKKDPIKKMAIRIRSCIASAFRYKGFKKNSKSTQILGCTYDELKNHIEKQFTKGMSWDRLSEIHIDHIIPLATAKTIEDVIALNHFTNLRPMWAKDNILKSNKLEFLL